jgi:threonine efflux protein
MSEVIAFSSMALTFFIVIASPGAATMSNATIAMHHGRMTSFAYGAGLSCGLAFWGAIAASGMGAALQNSPQFLVALKIGGGFYLFWLAQSSARLALLRGPDNDNVEVPVKSNWFLQGLILNLSNPKAVIAWMAALSVGLNATDTLFVVALATTVCIAVGFITNALYTIIFSLGGMMQLYKRCSRYLEGAMAALFALAGASLIASVFA